MTDPVTTNRGRVGGLRPLEIASSRNGISTQVDDVVVVQGLPASHDAFGRGRVSTPETIFDCQFQYDKQPLLWDELTSGTASSTHVPADGTVNMSVGTASGDRIVRQTFEYFRYQPGKSQFIKMTGILGSKATGSQLKYIGYGDDNNGVFFGRDSSTEAFVLLRSSVTGSVDDSRLVYQSNWNVDPMNGTGPSKLTLDWTKAQIFLIDLQFLGEGMVRMMVNIDGVSYPVHYFTNANRVTTTYMTTANLPVRYEIKNTGTAETGSMKQTCVEVESEGGQDNLAALPFQRQVLSISLGNGSANEALLLGLRPKTTFNSIENRSAFIPRSFGVVADGGTAVVRALYNPTITAGTWTDHDATYSAVQYNTTATGFSGGIQIGGDVIPAGSGPQNPPAGGQRGLGDRLPFGLDIAGTTPINFGIVGYGLGAGVTAHLVVDWEEIR